MSLEKLTSKEALALAKVAEWEKDDRQIPGTMYKGKFQNIAELDVLKHSDNEYKLFVYSIVDGDRFEAYFSAQSDAAKAYDLAEEAILSQKHDEGIKKIRAYLERR